MSDRITEGPLPTWRQRLGWYIDGWISAFDFFGALRPNYYRHKYEHGGDGVCVHCERGPHD